MSKLILIKHAAPEVVAGVPSEQWRLSEQGRAACPRLAEALRRHAPAVVVASEEPKAAETGELVARELNVPFHTAAGLHEHDRSNVPHMRSGEFISMMEVLFRKPNQLVLGTETAAGALKRFRNALDDVLEQHGGDGKTVAAVSHGTVIALLLEHLAGPGGRRGFDVWRAMKLPSYAVLRLPGMAVDEVVDQLPGVSPGAGPPGGSSGPGSRTSASPPPGRRL
jgi:broad specificity phosphatase PhoE